MLSSICRSCLGCLRRRRPIPFDIFFERKLELLDVAFVFHPQFLVLCLEGLTEHLNVCIFLLQIVSEPFDVKVFLFARLLLIYQL